MSTTTSVYVRETCNIVEHVSYLAFQKIVDIVNVVVVANFFNVVFNIVVVDVVYSVAISVGKLSRISRFVILIVANIISIIIFVSIIVITIISIIIIEEYLQHISEGLDGDGSSGNR